MDRKEQKRIAQYHADIRIRDDMERAKTECAMKTGLLISQVEKLQKDGYAISEIMAGEPRGRYFVPKTLIKVVPNFSILA